MSEPQTIQSCGGSCALVAPAPAPAPALIDGSSRDVGSCSASPARTSQTSDVSKKKRKKRKNALNGSSPGVDASISTASSAPPVGGQSLQDKEHVTLNLRSSQEAASVSPRKPSTRALDEPKSPRSPRNSPRSLSASALQLTPRSAHRKSKTIESPGPATPSGSSSIRTSTSPTTPRLTIGDSSPSPARKKTSFIQRLRTSSNAQKSPSREVSAFP